MDEAQVSMTKAFLWEEAKGKLRAMAMAEAWRGKTHPQTVESEKACTERWMHLHARVEAVISEFEDNGLSE